MSYLVSPTTFHQIALLFKSYRWKLLIWCVAALSIFILLMPYVSPATSTPLLLLFFFILFIALQCLVCSAFIFFFNRLPSEKDHQKSLRGFYRFIEWGEVCLFTVILPWPAVVYIYGAWVLFAR